MKRETDLGGVFDLKRSEPLSFYMVVSFKDYFLFKDS